jgi:hypothetical protein
LFEQTDRRLFFELTGYKIDIEGNYEEIKDYSGNDRKFRDLKDPTFNTESILCERNIN